MNSNTRRSIALLAVLALSFGAACTDAPSAPDAEWSTRGQLAIAPQLALTGGPAATSHTASDALRAAFDRVDRFRMVVTRLDGEVVADEVILVSGDPPYELSLSVPVNRPNEEFDVELTALAGATELFRAGPIRVRAVPEGVQTEPTAVDAGLQYTGPGATAASLTVTPDAQVLGPGAEGEVEVEVLDDGGNVVHAVPVVLSSSDGGVVSVSADGELVAGATGAAEVTATTPTGLTGSAWVYVVEGSVVFVRGGRIWEAGLTSRTATRLVDRSGAGQPSFSADGSRLVYVRNGTVFDGGGAELLSGSWPSISPDGSKVAADGGGTVVFANADGSNVTPGPEGGAPVWLPGGSALLVQGNSLERVDAAGEGRSTVVDDPGAGPGAVTADGRVAYVGGDGALRVSGAGELTPPGSAGSRPAWSADGEWLVVSMGGRLHLVPADGRGPAAPLPVGEGTEPAWRGHGFGQDVPTLSISGMDPERPRVGDELTISGEGFDAIIPTNNRVTFPGEAPAAVSGGPRPVIAGEVLEVTPTSIVTVVPEGAEAGDVTVETYTSQAAARFVPAPGLLRVSLTTAGGRAVEGATVRAVADGEVRGSGTTGADGSVEIADLPADRYTLELDLPDGFSFEGPAEASVRSGEDTEVGLTIDTEIVRVEVEPDAPTVGVGQGLSLTARGFDVFGDRVTELESSSWTALNSRITLSGGGFEGGLTGQHPSVERGDAGFEVTLDGVTASGAATVTTFISGTVESGAVAESPPPAGVAGPQPVGVSGIPVELLRDGEVVNRTLTDANGDYRFDNILGGPVVVRVQPSDDYRVAPEQHELTLDENTPLARNVDFTLETLGGGGDGDLVVFNDTNIWDGGGMGDPNNVRMVQNLVSFSNGGPRSGGTKVWLDKGRSAARGCCGILSTFINTIQGEGLTFDEISTSGGSLTSIPSDVKVLFLWVPRVAFTVSEVNTLKQFISDGGRVVYIAEYESFYGSIGIAVLNQLLSDMGAQMRNLGGIVASGYQVAPGSSLRSHQITEGMTQVTLAALSVLDPGPNDAPLFFDPTNTHLVAAVPEIDLTPLPATVASVESRIQARLESMPSASAPLSGTQELKASGEGLEDDPPER